LSWPGLVGRCQSAKTTAFALPFPLKTSFPTKSPSIHGSVFHDRATRLFAKVQGKLISRGCIRMGDRPRIKIKYRSAVKMVQDCSKMLRFVALCARFVALYDVLSMNIESLSMVDDS
jgi:hypothetical protein